ncbi:uncharacterized protein LOC135105521 isoform X2 [Scylla paramamosain]|uniref:uncharacterized protein LOC135105521 isoform X2 n=1 Tax=Scylla paramamosain TaxID=85552 RepID=UPI0030833CA2
MGTRNLPPKAWMLGASLDLPSTQSTGEESEVTLPTCIPVPDDQPETSPVALSGFKGQLDSAVSQYISQVKDLGFKDEPAKDHKLLAVKFQLDAQDINLKDEEEVDAVKEILKEDKGQQTQLEEEEDVDEEVLDVLEEEVPSLDNPLYLTLSECNSGLLDPFEEPGSVHFYENSRGAEGGRAHLRERRQLCRGVRHVRE